MGPSISGDLQICIFSVPLRYLNFYLDALGHNRKGLDIKIFKITVHTLPNISRNTVNQTMKLGRFLVNNN